MTWWEVMYGTMHLGAECVPYSLYCGWELLVRFCHRKCVLSALEVAVDILSTAAGVFVGTFVCLRVHMQGCMHKCMRGNAVWIWVSE